MISTIYSWKKENSLFGGSPYLRNCMFLPVQEKRLKTPPRADRPESDGTLVQTRGSDCVDICHQLKRSARSPLLTQRKGILCYTQALRAFLWFWERLPGGRSHDNSGFSLCQEATFLLVERLQSSYIIKITFSFPICSVYPPVKASVLIPSCLTPMWGLWEVPR